MIAPGSVSTNSDSCSTLQKYNNLKTKIICVRSSATKRKIFSTVWWMRVGIIDSQLSSILAFYKKFKIHTVY